MSAFKFRIYFRIYSLIISGIIVSLKANSQQSADPQFLQKIQLQRAIVIIKYQPHEDKFHWEMGGGFIINGKYVATCYHIRKAYREKIEQVLILFISNPDASSYDTVSADLNYVPAKNQYDFRKHKYDSADHSTDFIIYKLKRPISNRNPSYSTKFAKIGDSLFTIANLPKDKNSDFTNTHEVEGRGKYILAMPEKKQGCNFYFFINNLQSGFSGSPIYNVNGEIQGIYLFDYPNYNEGFFSELTKHGLSLPRKKEIEDGYKMGLRLGAYIGIDYLLRTYMEGYLN
jgi:hypothetical protein